LSRRARRAPCRLLRVVVDLPAPLVAFLLDFAEAIPHQGEPDITDALIEILTAVREDEAEFVLRTLPEVAGIH